MCASHVVKRRKNVFIYIYVHTRTVLYIHMYSILCNICECIYIYTAYVRTYIHKNSRNLSLVSYKLVNDYRDVNMHSCSTSIEHSFSTLKLQWLTFSNNIFPKNLTVTKVFKKALYTKKIEIPQPLKNLKQNQRYNFYTKNTFDNITNGNFSAVCGYLCIYILLKILS